MLRVMSVIPEFKAGKVIKVGRVSRVTAIRDLRVLQVSTVFRVGRAGRVRAARLIGFRQPTGGRTEVLLTRRIDAVRWQALLKPAKKLGAGTVVACDGIDVEILSYPVNGVSTVVLRCDGEIEKAIAGTGTVPLPPYFHGQLDTPDRYQTMFASALGSSAAPTAALHFTDNVIRRLYAGGVRIVEVELEVGLDTFRPMGEGSVAAAQDVNGSIVVTADLIFTSSQEHPNRLI